MDISRKLYEVSLELCPHHPRIEVASDQERLQIIKDTFRALESACDELHEIIRSLKPEIYQTKTTQNSKSNEKCLISQF